MDIASDLAENSPFKETQESFSTSRDWRIRCCVAKNKKVFPDILERLSKDKSLHVRKTVARNPECPHEILKDMLEKEVIRGCGKVTKNSLICLLVRNPSLPVKNLSEIAGEFHMVPEITDSVIESPNVTSEIIHLLLSDKETKFLPETLYKIAAHEKTDGKSFEELMDLDLFQNPYFRNTLVQNPNCPSDCLHLIAMKTADSNTHYWIAKHRNCPVSLLRKYFSRRSYLYALAQNPSIPEDVALGIIETVHKNRIPNKDDYMELLMSSPSCTRNILEAIVEKGTGKTAEKARRKLK